MGGGARTDGFTRETSWKMTRPPLDSLGVTPISLLGYSSQSDESDFGLDQDTRPDVIRPLVNLNLGVHRHAQLNRLGCQPRDPESGSED